jgi:hypothetical protein
MIPTGVAAAILGDIGFQRKNWLARFSTFSTVSAHRRLCKKQSRMSVAEGIADTPSSATREQQRLGQNWYFEMARKRS